MTSNLSRNSIVLLGIFLLLFFSSCAYLNREDYTIKTAQKYLAEGDFQKAIETYHVAYNKYPRDTELRNNYVKTIKYIKNNADTAFDRKDFALAGFIFRTLLNNYSNVKDFDGSLTFDRDFLHNRITTCSKILTEKGLVKYRDGNLEEAISIWKNILKFDPENAEIKKAIDTATTQLKQLQK